MSKTLFDAYVTGNTSLDIKKSEDEKISLDLITESSDPLDIEDDFFKSEEVVQEATSKTKINRDKNKIKDDLDYDKSSGMGSLTEPSTGRSVDVKLTFNNSDTTHVGPGYRENDKIVVPMNINPNDLNRGHGFTKYLHEKNHILQDLRKTSVASYENGKYSPKIERVGENDKNDLKLINAFIHKHSSEIVSKHSKDPDEYLADLSVARKRGFNNVIRMLQDLRKDSPSFKNYNAFIKKSSEYDAKTYYDDKKLDATYEQYLKDIKTNEHKLELGTYNENMSSNVMKHLEDTIKSMKKNSESKEAFKKFMTDKKALDEYEKRINEYNSDIDMRIKFLRDMKKIDTRNNEIIEEMYRPNYVEGNDSYVDCVHHIAEGACNNTKILQDKIDEFIFEHFSDNDIIIANRDSINSDILSHIVIEYAESVEDDGVVDDANHSLTDTSASADVAADTQDTAAVPEDTATTTDTASAIDATNNVTESVETAEPVQEGFFSKKKDEGISKKTGRKLKKLSYDPKSKTIEIEDDEGNNKRVHVIISDEKSLRKAIAAIDKALESFSENSKSDNRALLKKRNELVAELTEIVDNTFAAGVTNNGLVVVHMSTDSLEKMSAKDIASIMEHEKEHVRQFTRIKGTESADDPDLLLIDDASLQFIYKWRSSEKGKGLTASHDRLDYELTADAATIRKYGYRRFKHAMNKLIKNTYSYETFSMNINKSLADIDKDFKRIERMIHMVGDSNDDLSDKEVHKIFKTVRENLDTFRVAAAKAEEGMIEASKTADSGFKAKLKKAGLTILNIFKETKDPYKYCSKYTETEIIKRLEPNERREAIRYLYDSKLNEYIKKYNFESMDEFFKLVVEYNKKAIDVRLAFAKDYDQWYRSRRNRYIKECIEYALRDEDIVCEGYMFENLIAAVSEDVPYMESVDADESKTPFGKLRADVDKALGDKARVNAIKKDARTGQNRFMIFLGNVVTAIIDLGNKCCKAVAHDIGTSKMKVLFSKASNEDAVDNIRNLFTNPDVVKSPDVILEGFIYDVSRFDDTVSEYATLFEDVYMEEADENDAETEAILDETTKEATETDKEDDKSDDAEKEDEPEEEDEEEVIEIEDDLIGFGSDDSDVQNEFDPKDIEILNKLVAAESDAINDYFDGAKDCHDETLRRLFGDIGHEERFHLEQLLYAKSTLTGEKYDPRDPEVKKEYEELIEMGMDEDTAANTAIDKTYTAGRDESDMSDEIEIEQEVANIYEQMLRDNIINDMIMEAVDKNEITESMSVFLEAFVYQEEVMNSSYASKEMSSIPNPIALLVKAFKGFINALIKLSHSLKESYTKNRMKRKARMDWIKKNGISGLFKSGIRLYFYNPDTSRVDIDQPCKYVDMLYRMSVMIGTQCGIKVTTKHKTIKNPIKFNSIEQGIGILKRAMFTTTKVVVTDSNKDVIARDFFGYSDTKINVNVKHGDEAPTIHDSDNAFNSLDILINVTKQYADISMEVLEQLEKLEGNPSSVFYKNRTVYNDSVKNMKIIVNYFNKFITAIGHDMNVMLKLDNGLLAMTRQRDTLEQSGGNWEGPDVRTTKSTATSDNTTGNHTKLQNDKASLKAKKKLEKAQRKLQSKMD